MSTTTTQPTSLPLIACSLDVHGERERLLEWAELLRQAALREEIAGGLRYSFPASDGLENRIRDLVAAEHECCSFLAFDVARAGDDLELTVTAPKDGQDALRFIFSTQVERPSRPARR